MWSCCFRPSGPNTPHRLQQTLDTESGDPTSVEPLEAPRVKIWTKRHLCALALRRGAIWQRAQSRLLREPRSCAVRWQKVRGCGGGGGEATPDEGPRGSRASQPTGSERRAAHCRVICAESRQQNHTKPFHHTWANHSPVQVHAAPRFASRSGPRVPPPDCHNGHPRPAGRAST